MFIRSRKIVVMAVLLVVVLSSSAFAWVNLALTAAEVAAPFVVSGAINYLLPSPPTTHVPTYGRADSYGVKRNAIGVRNGIAVAVTLGLGYMAIRDIMAIAGASYPAMQDAMSTPVGNPADGTVVKAPDGNNYRLTYLYAQDIQLNSDGKGWVPDYGTRATWRYSSNLYIWGLEEAPGWPGTYKRIVIYSISLTSDPATIGGPVTDAQLMQMITDSSGAIKPAYQHDLDAMILANPSLVSKPDAVVNANYEAAAKDGMLSSLNNSVQAATAARDAAQRIYDANPTDENLLQLQQAEKALQDAQANSLKQTSDIVKQEQDENLVPSSPDALKSFNFTKLNQLKGALSDAWPFSLLTGVASKLQILVRDPHAPSFDLPVYGNNHLHVDLAVFDPVATCCRWAIGLLLSVGAVWYLVEFWRGR